MTKCLTRVLQSGIAAAQLQLDKSFYHSYPHPSTCGRWVAETPLCIAARSCTLQESPTFVVPSDIAALPAAAYHRALWLLQLATA